MRNLSRSYADKLSAALTVVNPKDKLAEVLKKVQDAVFEESSSSSTTVDAVKLALPELKEMVKNTLNLT